MDTYGRLTELLDERGLTLYQAAKLSHLSRSTLTNARDRGGQLSVDTIERLCDGLGITLGEFFAAREG
ncbi:MAG: helix-turn-helix transcriptional regulator [Oscillospiraceae bacterium]|nr:helix-turn-helix transcriptional regulator [Oscillospiraceae bacterium]